MTDAASKHERLIELLLVKTKEAKIPWEYDSARKTASVWNNDILLTLSKGENENYEDVYTVSLFNRSGDFLEGFNDESLTAVNPVFGEESHFRRMSKLFDLAMRQATGADKALDDFIEAVASDRLVSF